MSNYSFSQSEQYAVYTVHRERCYLCRKPLDISSMEVDHVIPESHIDSPDLPRILESLGRPSNFNLNDYENWLPSCRRCNGEKADLVFDPAPIILVRLQKLAEKKDKAIQMAKEVVSKRKVTLALNTLLRARDEEQLTAHEIEEIRPLIDYHLSNPGRVANDQPFRLRPAFEVLFDDGNIRTIKGPYGIGGGPSHPSEHARCPSCGWAAFNGARCVACGEMGDF